MSVNSLTPVVNGWSAGPSALRAHGARPASLRSQVMNVARSIGLFVAAGLAEIGGGYLVWRWLREGSPWPVGLAGAVILVVYGVIPTFQSSADFGRVYAAYGGVFVIMSLLWGWVVDGNRPDNYDWLGAAIVAVGVAVIYFSPRHA